jgi:hypothetical protein
LHLFWCSCASVGIAASKDAVTTRASCVLRWVERCPIASWVVFSCLPLKVVAIEGCCEHGDSYHLWPSMHGVRRHLLHCCRMHFTSACYTFSFSADVVVLTGCCCDRRQLLQDPFLLQP